MRKNLLTDEEINIRLKENEARWKYHKEKGLWPTKKISNKVDLKQLERDGKRFLKNKGIFVKEE